MDVSIIIINYKTKDLTFQCIQSIYDYTKNVSFEIILVDNASEDDTIEKVNEKFPDVITIANTENIGFGRANNQGIRIAKGEFVFLLNSDAYLINNAISDFVYFLRSEKNQSVAICGGDLFYDNSCQKRVPSFGNFPSLKEQFFMLGPYKLFKSYHTKHVSSGVINYDDKIKKVDFVIGADMFIRKSVLDEIGMFDDDFFMYFEETELSYRAYRVGYKSVIIPSIRLCHLDGGSTNKNVNSGFNYRKFESFEKSRILYFKKCKGYSYSVFSKILSFFLILELSLFSKGYGNFFRKTKILFKL